MKNLIWKISAMICVVCLVIGLVFAWPKKDNLTSNKIEDSEKDGIEKGIHISTGLKATENYELVVANCTGCHSAKLVIQNRMSKNQWNVAIKWMQDTQNLWDLGDNQEKIVSYLVENYPINDTGRRANLTTLDWYRLEK